MSPILDQVLSHKVSRQKTSFKTFMIGSVKYCFLNYIITYTIFISMRMYLIKTAQ